MMDIISESFNFNRFCEAVKDLEFLQLINAVQDEIGRLKHHLKRIVEFVNLLAEVKKIITIRI